MSDLISEIEKDIRDERTQARWHSFGKLMVGASVLVIIATVIIVIWQDHKQNVAMEQTSQFMKGLDRLKVEDYQGAISAFGTLADDEHSSYYGLAMLRKAQAQTALGDKDGALRTYRALAKATREQDKAFAGIAKIEAASIAGDAVTPEKNAPLAASENEWKAWQMMGQDKKDDAVKIFAELYHDDKAPASLRERAAEMLAHLAPEKLANHAPELAKGPSDE